MSIGEVLCDFELLLVMVPFQYPFCFVALNRCSRIFNSKSKSIAHKVCILKMIGADNNFDIVFFDKLVILFFPAFDKTFVIFFIQDLSQNSYQVWSC